MDRLAMIFMQLQMTLVITLVFVIMLRRLSPAQVPLRLMALIMAALTFVPAPMHSLSALALGIIGPLSLPASVLLVIALARRFEFVGAGARERDQSAYLWLIAPMGLLYYLLALGIGPVDPYRIGFVALWPAAGLFVLAAIALVRFPLWSLMLSAALVAHALRLTDSDNILDYLIDPYLVMALWVMWIRQWRPWSLARGVQ